MQLCLSLSITILSLSYHCLSLSLSVLICHSHLRLYTKNVFFAIESIKIINELSNGTPYLYPQLDYLNKIRCLKKNSLYLKLILLLSSHISSNPGPSRTNHLLTENLKVFKNRGLHFIQFNINSLLTKTDELGEIVKASNATAVGITESKLDNSTNDCEISVEGYNISRRDRGVVPWV